MLLVLLLLSVAVGATMAYFITRSVTVPLQEGVKTAALIAGGDLSQTLNSTRRDEIGDLLRALGQMQGALHQLVGQVRSSTDSISTASAEIATGNQDLSARTEQTASNLQQAAASMEQLTGTVAQSADSARQANRLAAGAAEVAGRGGVVVSQVVSTMNEITTSSKQISDIIGVIDGIAFQTNILALERGGGSGACRRTGPRLRGGGERSALAGAAQRAGRERDQGADRRVGRQGRERLAPGGRGRPDHAGDRRLGAACLRHRRRDHQCRRPNRATASAR